MVSNLVVLIGRFTKELELKTTENGKKFVNFILAVSRPKMKDQEHPESDFVSCTAWEEKAEFISKYFTKGSKIAIKGRLQTRLVEDGDKKNKLTTVIVEETEFVESKKADDQTEKKESKPAPAATPAATKHPVEEMDDELPF
jgi:single-strand DNA-binding protein